MNDKVVLRRLPTGVPGLDALLGGGLIEYSFNLIAGAPGSGKTTLAHQLMFSLASSERRALFITVMGEPSLKMLRYQQQYSFFDSAKLDDSIRFVNLGDEVLRGDFDRILQRILDEVERFEPSLVFVDSFRSMARATGGADANHAVLQQFVQRLGMHLTSQQATSFLIGEYHTVDSEADPIFTVADGVFVLMQSVHRNSMVRKMQITKSRGQATISGLHTFRISAAGIQVFPRTLSAMAAHASGADPPGAMRPALGMGNPVLDEMMGGGLPPGYSLLVAGPSGSGKSLLATGFLAEGARIGEKGVVAAFEKGVGQTHNPRLDELVDSGHVAVIDTRALVYFISLTVLGLVISFRSLESRKWS